MIYKLIASSTMLLLFTMGDLEQNVAAVQIGESNTDLVLAEADRRWRRSRAYRKRLGGNPMGRLKLIRGRKNRAFRRN